MIAFDYLNTCISYVCHIRTVYVVNEVAHYFVAQSINGYGT